MVALQAAVLALFGEFALGDTLMARALARITAPVVGLFYGDGARDELLVVHLDAPSLDVAGGNWPLPYRYHARVLRTLAAYEPTAVFVDFTFESSRPDDSVGELADTICDLRHRGIAVFLAAPASDEGNALRPELEAIRTRDDKGCFEAVGVEQIRDAFDRMAWSYPLYSRGGTAGELHSAALAIATQRNPGLAAAHIEPEARLAVTWGTKSSHFGLDWLDSGSPGHAGEHEVPTRAYCRPWIFWTLLPPYLRPGSFLNPHDADNRPVCVFHDSLPSGDLLRRKSETDNQRLAGLVKGRTVLYGASFNAGDFAISPIHDELPGVFLHAMAADNLLHFGADWKRIPEGGTAGFMHIAFLFMGFLVVTFCFRQSTKGLQWGQRSVLKWRRDQPSRPLPWPDSRPRRDGCLVVFFISIANVGREMFVHSAMGLLRFFGLMLIPGMPLVFIAHYWFNYGILAYAEIMVFCALAEALELGERTERAIEKAHGRPSPDHAH